jgi:hypothetical protein
MQAKRVAHPDCAADCDSDCFSDLIHTNVRGDQEFAMRMAEQPKSVWN